MRFSLLAVASLVSLAAAEQQLPADPQLVDVVGSRILPNSDDASAWTAADDRKPAPAGAAASSSSFLQHYGSPAAGCEDDEKSFQISGVPGGVCSTKCTDFLPCPTDVPAGVTATPMCALQDPSTGSQYCILVCQSGGDNNDGEGTNSLLRSSSSNVRDDQCGDAVCRPVQGQDGLGICTYDV